MSGVEAYSGEVASGDDFFTRWLKRLHHSLQELHNSSTLLTAGDLAPPETKSLVLKVIAIIDEGQGHLPKWLETLKKDKGDQFKKIISMISFGEELKTKLGKLRTPYAMRELNEIRKRYINILDKKGNETGDLTSSAAFTSSIPLLDLADGFQNPVDKVLSFLSNIEETKGDNVLEFCRLADANHRYHTVSKVDSTRLRKLLDIENGRKSSATASINLLEKRLRNVSECTVSGTDSDDTVVSRGISLIENELSISNEKLRQAESEEEEARLAYERACQARKKAATKVTGLVDTISTIQTHKQLIADVSGRRLDLAKYSNSVALDGIELLSEFQAYMESVQSSMGKPQVTQEVPAIFSHIISSFTSHLASQMEGAAHVSRIDQFNVVMNEQVRPYFSHFESHDIDDDVSKMDLTLKCLAQIGLEMTRLWRQLNTDDTYTDEVWATITKFEQEIQTKYMKSAVNTVKFPLDQNLLKNQYFQRDTQHIPRYQDSTVVLYYDHLKHLTPKWHFENIQRFTTSMKMLVDQKARPVNYDTTWLPETDDDESLDVDSGPSKKHCRRGRELELLCCNDVVAPPLWTLPMTHNPTYLQHLYEVAIEANEKNIYAPLEFESDFDDDDEEDSKEPPQDVEDKKYPLSLNSDVSAILGPQLEEQFLSILRIDKKDSLLSNTLASSRKASKKNVSESEGGNVTGRVGNDTGISFTIGKQGHTSKRQVSMRVVTPYGMGVIIDKVREVDGIQKVSLDWGATCYFNSSSIQKISDCQQMKDSVGDVLPVHIRTLLTAWRNIYGSGGDFESASDDDMDVELNDDDDNIDVTLSPFMKFIANCLANVCGVQRPVAELFKINPSTFSAWLNGRASDSMCDSATQSVKKIFKRYSYDEVVRMLNPEDDTSSDRASVDSDPIDNNGGDARTSEPHTPARVSEKPTATPLDKSNSKNGTPRSKIGTSSPRFEYDMYSLTNFDGYRGQIAQRPPKETDQSEKFRNIVRSLMKRNELTENLIAQEFSMKFEPTKPGTIVSWLYYRTTYQMDAKLNFYMFLWIEERRTSLSEQENKDFEKLRLYVESTSNARNDDNGDMEKINNDTKIDDIPTVSNNEEAVQQGVDMEKSITKTRNSEDESEGVAGQNCSDDNDSIDIELSRGPGDDEVDISEVSDNEQDLSMSNSPLTSRPSKEVSSSDDTLGDIGIGGSEIDDHVPISKPAPLPLSDINTLRFTIIDEIMRRGITQTTAAEEANLCIIGLSQAAISKLLHKGSFGSGTKALKFKNLMEDWVANSKLQPDGEFVKKVVPTTIKKENNDLDGHISAQESSGHMEKAISPSAQRNNITEGVNGTVEDVDGGLKSKDMKGINPANVVLRDEMLEEMKRRGCFQSDIIEESGLSIHGFSQPNISRFIHSVYVMGGERGVLFKQMVKKWIKRSRRKHQLPWGCEEERGNAIPEGSASDGENESEDEVDKDEDKMNSEHHMDAEETLTEVLEVDDETLIPLLELRKVIMHEIHRRGISQRGAAIEAKFDKNSLPYCAVNRLINNSKCNTDASGIKFRKLMQSWLQMSRNEPTVNDAAAGGGEGSDISDVEDDIDDIENDDDGDEKSEAQLLMEGESAELLNELQEEVRGEIARRNMYQSSVAKEAKLNKISCDQSHLSRFLLGRRMPGYGRAEQFREYLAEWLVLSKTMETPKVEKVVSASTSAPLPKSNPGVINVTGLLSTEQLQFEVNSETYRRSVSISTVFMEADIASSTVSNSALARYLQKGNCPVGERGVVFRTCLEDWLKVSKTKPEVTVKTVKDRTANVAAVGTSKVVTIKGIRDTADDDSHRLSQRRKASSISSQNSDDGDVDSCDYNDPPSKQARRQLGEACEGKGDLHVPLIKADRFKENFHHPWCRECNSGNNKQGKSGEMMECGSCPYAFHTGCEDSSNSSYLPRLPSNFSNSLQSQQWFCSRCRSSGAPFAQRLKTSDIESGLTGQPWVLFYASHLRRWRQGYVCDIDESRRLLLCKWWRTDGKWGKSNWVDINNGAPMLWHPKASEFLDINDDKGAKCREAAVFELSKTSPHYFGPFSSIPTTSKSMSVANSVQQSHGLSLSQTTHMSEESSDSTVTTNNRAGDRNTSSTSSRRYRERTQKAKEEEKEEPIQSNIDTFLSAESLKAACCAAGIACRAVDVVMCGSNTNAFVCSRPPGHHAGRKGFTEKCRGTGFCLLNNAAIAMLYARVRWGVQRVAVVDIDVHFGNGTSELLKDDPRAFFGCVHMIYGEENEGFGNEMTERRKRMAACCGPTALRSGHEVSGSRGSANNSGGLKERNAMDRIESFKEGFFPHALGCTDIQERYMSVGVYPNIHNNLSSVETDGSNNKTSTAKPFPQSSLCGPAGFRTALRDHIIPKMEAFDPELLIISAGFDGLASDPLGGDLGLSTSDFSWATHALLQSMNRVGGSGHGRVVSLLEGGYDIKRESLGLANSINAHVKAMRKHPVPVGAGASC